MDYNYGGFTVFAHRGASEYAPENTLLSFYLGMHMEANGIETDVQSTKDGVLVLFHDDTMERVAGVNGKVSDYTYAEIMKMNVTEHGHYDKIVTFDDFLRLFAFRDIHLAIELKQQGIAKKVAELIDKYCDVTRVTVTSFDFEALREMHEAAPHINLGLLKWEITEEDIAFCRQQGIEELCPAAENTEKDKVDYWHSLGFNVRAWGVFNEELMRKVYDNGANGTTVNFPDKLIAYIKSKE